MLVRFPKKDVIRGRGSIWHWGFAIADVYSTKTNVGNRQGCEGLGSVVLGFWGAGTASEAR